MKWILLIAALMFFGCGDDVAEGDAAATDGGVYDAVETVEASVDMELDTAVSDAELDLAPDTTED